VKDGPGWPATVLAVACAILLGALVAWAIGPGDDEDDIAAQTVTISRTVTVSGPITNPGTVVIRVLVPKVVGQRLDIAKRQLELRRFEVDVDGGGLLGVVNERNWRVTKQQPAPGTYLEQGSSVRVTVER
jgi:hypothetical protein